MVPPALGSRLAEAPRTALEAARPQRARYLVAAYGDLIADRSALDAAFARLPVRPSAERLSAWRAMVGAGAFAELAEAIMGLHYDPAYDRSRRKHERPLLGAVSLIPGEPASQDAAAGEIVRLLARLTPAHSGARK
jgi:tRNA 2-selenouridine synthase